MAEALNGNRHILVVGGGITGLSAALEAAEAGFPVILVEKGASLGGRVARMNKYFPKLCPPNCGLEINFRRLKNNPLIHFYTQAEVEKVEGEAGALDITVRINPRYVNKKCTACGLCEAAATTHLPDPFNYGLKQIKAAHLPHEFAFPLRYVIAPEVVGTPEADRIKAACPYDAIDLDMVSQEVKLQAAAIIWAAGWRPYEAEKIGYYGFGKHRNVITNVMLERFAAANGPTDGSITRPSDGGEVKRIAFVQCAGSRDENHLPYCSGVCCLASLKQATYLLEQNPEARVTIFFIDIRALGRYEEFSAKVLADERVSLVKGKAGEITEDPASGLVTVQVEDQATGKILKDQFDLVVLAAGMVPNSPTFTVQDRDVAIDDSGFILTDQAAAGIIGAGCAKQPVDVATCVQDATAAALKAIQAAGRR
jgi:quinone-modifying oxidoreductase, subunit QmoA